MSSMHKYFAVMAVSVLFARPVAAQKHSLAELMSLALKSNPLLTAQDARVEEKSLSAAQARVWPGPSAGLLFGRTRQTETSGSRYELSLSQSISLTGIPGLRGRLLGLESQSLRIERGGGGPGHAQRRTGAYEHAAGRRKVPRGEPPPALSWSSPYLAIAFPTPQRLAESRIVTNRQDLSPGDSGEAAYKAFWRN